MRTVFFTYVRLSLDFDFLHEAFVLVNVSTAPGATDIWLSVTLNELHTVTMRLTQFSMVFDISRFLRTIIGRDSRFLSIRFFCECHIFEKVTQCPQIRYHKPKILVKFCWIRKRFGYAKKRKKKKLIQFAIWNRVHMGFFNLKHCFNQVVLGKMPNPFIIQGQTIRQPLSPPKKHSYIIIIIIIIIDKKKDLFWLNINVYIWHLRGDN